MNKINEIGSWIKKVATDTWNGVVILAKAIAFFFGVYGAYHFFNNLPEVTKALEIAQK